PKLCRGAERLAEPKRSVRRNTGLFAGDPLDPCARQAAGLGKSAREIFSGIRNSSRRTSPGCMGLSFLAIVASSSSGSPRFRPRQGLAASRQSKPELVVDPDRVLAHRDKGRYVPEHTN